jgi:NADPH:quinone reductase-like Zn-dependent oxidoreductase
VTGSVPDDTLLSAAPMLVEPDLAGLRGLADLVERGLLTVRVDATYPLAEVAEAHERGRTGRTRGKLVLIP